MAETPATAVETLTFEDAIKELEAIVSQLERGEVPLAESVEKYERGAQLKAHCERLLRAAEERVEKVRLTESGQPAGVEPLDGG